MADGCEPGTHQRQSSRTGITNDLRSQCGCLESHLSPRARPRAPSAGKWRERGWQPGASASLAPHCNPSRLSGGGQRVSGPAETRERRSQRRRSGKGKPREGGSGNRDRDRLPPPQSEPKMAAGAAEIGRAHV